MTDVNESDLSNNTPKFLIIFRKMMKDILDNENICTWDDNGTITISDLKKFEIYHNKYFEYHKTISSFRRQLNNYNFTMTTDDKYTYIKNKYFCKNKVDYVPRKKFIIKESRKRNFDEIDEISQLKEQVNMLTKENEALKIENQELKYLLDGKFKNSCAPPLHKFDYELVPNTEPNPYELNIFKS